MASISKREDDRADEIEQAPWNERPVIGTSQGLPWWQAILLGFGLTLFAAVVDLQFNGQLTVLFQGAYFVACIAAIGWVRRDSLFGPMVQPPLILAIIVPGVVVFGSEGPDGTGLKDILLGYGLPVINGFPTMAVTTGVTLAAGFARLYLQRDPDRTKQDDEAEDQPPAPPARRDASRRAPEPTPDADRPPRGGEPGEPPPGRRRTPAPGAPPSPGAAEPPVAGATGRSGSGPTQRPPRTPSPERRRDAAGGGPPPERRRDAAGPPPPERMRKAPGAGQPPPPGRRRAPSEPARRPPPGDAQEPPPRRAAPKPPPGSPPPPAGGQPPRRRPSRGGPPPEDPPRPPRRQPPPPRPRQ